jgi:hypothetical protein
MVRTLFEHWTGHDIFKVGKDVVEADGWDAKFAGAGLSRLCSLQIPAADRCLL